MIIDIWEKSNIWGQLDHKKVPKKQCFYNAPPAIYEVKSKKEPLTFHIAYNLDRVCEVVLTLTDFIT